MKRIVVGLDPGLKAQGFVAFDPDSKELLYAARLVTKKKLQWERIKDIASQVEDGLASIDPEIELFVFCEAFVLRGKAGEALARLTGALMSSVPNQASFDFCYNTTVKKVIGGHGHAEKSQVAAGVYKWAASNAEPQKPGRALIEAGEMDVLDAFAIGLAGWMEAGN